MWDRIRSVFIYRCIEVSFNFRDLLKFEIEIIHKSPKIVETKKSMSKDSSDTLTIRVTDGVRIFVVGRNLSLSLLLAYKTMNEKPFFFPTD